MYKLIARLLQLNLRFVFFFLNVETFDFYVKELSIMHKFGTRPPILIVFNAFGNLILNKQEYIY